MKKSFTILMTAALMLLSGLGWAQTRTEVTWTASEQEYTNGQEITDVTFDENVAATFAKGTNSNAPKYYTSGTAIRCYGGNYFTVSSDYDLTQIVITFGSSDGSNAITTDCGTYENGTWTGAANSVTFTIGGTSGNRRIAGFAITYSAEAPEVFAPTFNPAGGTYTEAQTVSISCETDGATIYYTTDGTAPDNNSTEYTGAITVSETMTIKAIAYVGTDASTVASATYTILTLMTIAEARAQGTGVVYTSGTVTSYVGTTGYIQDASAAICVYGTSLTVGDEIAVSGTLSTYNGLLEITSPVVDVISSGNTVEPTTMTIAEVNSSTNQGWYVRIENATVTEINGQNTTIAQGENTIVVRGILGIEYQVNDIISLNGNIGCHNDVAQIANPQNVTVQESEEPAILVEPTTINVPCAAAEGTLTVTYQNIETELGPEIYWYESDGTTAAEYDWVTADFNENGNIDYIIDANTGEARLAYMKVYGISTGGDDVYSELITFSQGHYISDYATLPFEFDGGKADIEDTDGLTQEGLGSDYSSSPKLKFDGTGDCLILHFNERPGTLTFDIKGNSFSGGTFKVQTSADGVSYSDLETYDTFGNNETLEEIFNDLDENVRYIKWIYTNKASGNVGLGNIKLAKYTGPVASITISDATVNIPAEGAEGTLTVAYENITEIIADVYFCDAEGEAASYDWIEAEINSENNVDYIIDVNDGEDRTAYLKVYALDDNTENVYSNLVTINQAAYVAPIADGKYVKVSSTADLTSGQYLIVYEEGSLAFNGSLETLDAVGNTIEVILNNNEIAVTETTTASEFTINTTNGTIKSASGYYIGQTSDANGMASSIETAYTNTITITDGNAVIVSSGAYLRYNSASNQTRFRYYKSSSYTGQKAIQLYKKVVEPETYTLDITGYGSNPGGYYLIASPVASVTPSTENGFLTEAYDLYEFDQSADNEWVNYEQHGFDIVSGKGYLYASQANTTLTFEGQPYNGNGKIDLVYDENANLKGWNLIGNPFGVTATVDHDYYIMNENGDNFMLTSKETPIDAMQGIFIVTESADDNKAVFTTEEPAAPGEKLVLNVTHNRGVVDRAMIRFGESQQMPKAMMSPNNTKIYIEQANNDYAVVRSDNESEMPVSFKAAANGTYTLSIDADNVEMDYLHLVDNMTGMDVDLLANPSYTFEANTTDYACRFKLVYKNTTGIEESGEHFAYFNGSEWVVSNEGDAQLHVIDMTGRIVSTETINGNATVKVNAAPGVYMLRLVNGNDIKTQKVIIK